MTTLEFRERLARRTRRAKAPITLAMLEPLEAYYRLLAQWNAKINLTALPLDAPTDETRKKLEEFQARILEVAGVASQNQVRALNRQLSKLSRRLDTLAGGKPDARA